MNRDNEITALASKLLRSGVTGTLMDAKKMAESMLTIDTNPNSASNEVLRNPISTKKEVPQTNTYSAVTSSDTSSNVLSRTEIDAEISEILSNNSGVSYSEKGKDEQVIVDNSSVENIESDFIADEKSQDLEETNLDEPVNVSNYHEEIDFTRNPLTDDLVVAKETDTSEDEFIDISNLNEDVASDSSISSSDFNPEEKVVVSQNLAEDYSASKILSENSEIVDVFESNAHPDEFFVDDSTELESKEEIDDSVESDGASSNLPDDESEDFIISSGDEEDITNIF